MLVQYESGSHRHSIPMSLSADYQDELSVTDFHILK